MEKNAKITINQKLENLQAQVDWFYSDEFSLDEALAKYKEAIKAADDVKVALEKMKNDVAILSKDWTK